jgi:chromosome segregation ATPase
MADNQQGELSLQVPDPESSPVAREAAKAALECKGIRSTTDFPADLSTLSREQIEHHYQAMRNSHASLTRSRSQLQRRSKELTIARERFLETLRGYENRLMALGQEKAEALRIAQDMHKELEAFEDKQLALDGLLKELDAAKEEAGYWGIFNINRLIERMRRLLSGASEV